jgi:hypothetical protein
MATIFLSYRRTDSPQACRVYEWLAQRFGYDSVFMDVAAIPIAVGFPDFIRQAIGGSSVLIALIGKSWLDGMADVDDPVRMEIEAALESRVLVLPVLIGNTAMPEATQLPASIAAIAAQNATSVGVSHDFHTHMRMLLPKIESILGALSKQSAAVSDPRSIFNACGGVIRYLKESYSSEPADPFHNPDLQWRVIGTAELYDVGMNQLDSVALFLHRVARLAESVELHFILSFWSRSGVREHLLSGWVMRQLDKTPLLHADFYTEAHSAPPAFTLKIRRSDEDTRQIWRMITSEPLRLSLAYVATLSPKTD